MKSHRRGQREAGRGCGGGEGGVWQRGGDGSIGVLEQGQEQEDCEEGGMVGGVRGKQGEGWRWREVFGSANGMEEGGWEREEFEGGTLKEGSRLKRGEGGGEGSVDGMG